MRAIAWAAVAVFVLLAGCGAVNTEEPSKPMVVGDWVALPEGPLSARHEAGGVWLDGEFVVVGGWGSPPCPPTASCRPPDDPALRDGAAFDPEKQTWRSIAQAPVPINAAGSLVAAGSSIYLLTGDETRTDSPRAFLRYDPREDRWSQLPAPPKRVGLVAAGDRVLAVDMAGRESDDHVFDPLKQIWRPLPRDPLGEHAVRTVAWLGDRLLRLEGDYGDSRTVRLATLDADLSTWTDVGRTDLVEAYPVAVDDLVVFPSYTWNGDDHPTPRPYGYGQVWDPAADTWSAITPPPRGAGWNNGRWPVVGDRISLDEHLFQPATMTWTKLPASPDRRTSEVTLAGNDTLFTWGGTVDSQQNRADGYFLHLG